MCAVGRLVALQGIQLEVNILLTVSESLSPYGASMVLLRWRGMCCYPYSENGLIKEPVLDYVYSHYGSEVVELMEQYPGPACRQQEGLFFIQYKELVQHASKCAYACVSAQICVCCVGV